MMDLGEALVVAQQQLKRGFRCLIRLISSSSASASVWVVTNSIARVSATMRCSRFGQAARMGVVDDPLLQVARLADIERLALGVEHAIDARARRQGAQRVADHGDAARERAAGAGSAASRPSISRVLSALAHARRHLARSAPVAVNPRRRRDRYPRNAVDKLVGKSLPRHVCRRANPRVSTCLPKF